ncbi:enhancer of rudimentary like protein [Quercus suber]|uniref:Enhancer of rudimentary like protein n=1 Tax=Quercus suber TaxID=58331 RepID=A0AAW0JA81_QUESU
MAMLVAVEFGGGAKMPLTTINRRLASRITTIPPSTIEAPQRVGGNLVSPGSNCCTTADFGKELGLCFFKADVLELNPAIRNITYDIADLYNFIDGLADMSALGSGTSVEFLPFLDLPA